jgi:hypothetical protein
MFYWVIIVTYMSLCSKPTVLTLENPNSFSGLLSNLLINPHKIKSNLPLPALQGSVV